MWGDLTKIFKAIDLFFRAGRTTLNDISIVSEAGALLGGWGLGKLEEESEKPWSIKVNYVRKPSSMIVPDQGDSIHEIFTLIVRSMIPGKYFTSAIKKIKITPHTIDTFECFGPFEAIVFFEQMLLNSKLNQNNERFVQRMILHKQV